MDATRTKPTVFVSSTCLDLKQIREDVKEFLDSKVDDPQSQSNNEDLEGEIPQGLFVST